MNKKQFFLEDRYGNREKVGEWEYLRAIHETRTHRSWMILPEIEVAKKCIDGRVSF